MNTPQRSGTLIIATLMEPVSRVDVAVIRTAQDTPAQHDHGYVKGWIGGGFASFLPAKPRRSVLLSRDSV
ncbi:MAG: hypothetical protein ACRDTJ_18185 [Pseudonocardiaceae bacterium]